MYCLHLGVEELSISPSSSKSTFSQPFKEKREGEVVRIGD